MKNRVEACIVLTTDSQIKLEEVKKKIIFLNPNRLEYKKVQVDGCTLKDGVKCDKLLLSTDEHEEYYMELKGIEEHPLEPFLPENAKLLFLGSFPPPKARWSMEFFYPNWINDFWRIQGLIHFGDKMYFEETDKKRFNKERIVAFCNEKGIALFDTAKKVRRLKDNADDNFLEIVEGTDVLELLEQMPECNTIVTTGGKASEELQSYIEKKGLKIKIPKVGEWVNIVLKDGAGDSSIKDDCSCGAIGDATIRWWRMPSSSRAYPMKLEKKAEFYKRLFLTQL